MTSYQADVEINNLIMKKTIIILTILIIIVLIILSFLNGLNIKNIHNFSASRQESIKNGFFSCDYFPIRKILKLKLRPEIIVFDTAWTEYSWVEEPTFLSSRLVKKEGTKNLAVKISSTTTDDFIYSIRLITNNGNDYLAFNTITKQHEGSIYSDIDTLKFIVEEKSVIDSLGWKKPIKTDTVYFIKKINH